MFLNQNIVLKQPLVFAFVWHAIIAFCDVHPASLNARHVDISTSTLISPQQHPQGNLHTSSLKIDANTDGIHSVLPGTERLSQTFSGFIAGNRSSTGFDLETFAVVNDASATHSNENNKHNAFRTSISTSTAATSTTTTTTETERIKDPTRNNHKHRSELNENFLSSESTSYIQRPSFMRIRQQNRNRKPTFRLFKEQRFLAQPMDSFRFGNPVADKGVLNFILGSTAISQAVLSDDHIDGNVFSGTRNDVNDNENSAEEVYTPSFGEYWHRPNENEHSLLRFKLNALTNRRWRWNAMQKEWPGLLAENGARHFSKERLSPADTFQSNFIDSVSSNN